MTITSKPRDGEEIIEVVKGILGSDKLVATPSLLAFFDDLADLANSDTQDLLQVFQAMSNILASINSNRVQTDREIQHVSSDPKYKTQISQINRRIDQLSSSYSQQICALTAKIGSMAAEQKSIKAKLNNLEQLWASNPVR